MSDRRRIVTISDTGTVTTVKDVEDSVSFFAVAGSFQVKPGERHTIMASRGRRYGGATAAGESHDNGEISWTALVRGTTPDLALQNVEDVLSVLEQPRLDLFFEWRPEGATNSVFYEIRGPAKWSTDYKWAQFAGALSMVVTIAIPVGPLARGLPSTITIPSTTTPGVVALSGTVAGDAPALADVTLRHSTGSQAPIWAMLAWTKRPAAPLSGSVVPFGAYEAETIGTSLTGWAVVASVNASGGNGLYINTAGAGSASALFAVDPSVLQPDDFARETVDIEVWARVDMVSTIVSPRFTLSLQPAAGVTFGGERFSTPHGSAGKILTKPASSFALRIVHLGTLAMPVTPGAPLKWNVKVAGSWAAGSSGLLGLDTLLFVPSRQRALSPTDKPNDSTYPKFIASTADTQKRIRGADLSGQVASATGNFGASPGLGGSPIELPPGTVDLLIKLSSVVPDDPTVDTSTEQINHTVTGSVLVWPRYWLARGS